MAIKIETNKVYKCISTMVGSASVHVVNGSVNVKGSNITEKDIKGDLIIPEIDELVSTGDTLEEGIHVLTGLPEWIAFEGDADEIWVKSGVDVRFIEDFANEGE
jgi:hypothetical protein